MLTLSVVSGVAGVGWWKLQPARTTTPVSATSRPALETGHDYYLFVKLIELRPTKSDGSRWDSGNDSAPDIRFDLYWQDLKIFSGTERDDTLIANWDLFRVDLKDVLTNGGKIDVANSINAPLVNVSEGGGVRIDVWDDDPIASDLVAKIDLDFASLKAGTNTIEYGETVAVKRIVIDLIDRNSDLQTLVELQTRR
jgi:hypothetical protein